MPYGEADAIAELTASYSGKPTQALYQEQARLMQELGNARDPVERRLCADCAPSTSACWTPNWPGEEHQQTRYRPAARTTRHSQVRNKHKHPVWTNRRPMRQQSPGWAAIGMVLSPCRSSPLVKPTAPHRIISATPQVQIKQCARNPGGSNPRLTGVCPAFRRPGFRLRPGLVRLLPGGERARRPLHSADIAVHGGVRGSAFCVRPFLRPPHDRSLTR